MDITVIGTGRAALPPERATIHLTAGFEGADKAQVVRRTTDLVNALSAELTRLREHESRPTTWSAVLPIGTRSWRPWSDKGTVLPMRYAASSRVQVKFRDFRALSGFADAWGGLEGVTLGHVEWTLTEATRKETDERVRAEAVVDARERAQVYATAAGGGVVRCVQIADPGLLSDGQADAPQVHAMSLRGAYKAMDAGGGEGGIEIAPEDVETTAVVNARFVAE